MDKWIQQVGLNPSLPYLLFDKEGQLLGANARMLALLSLSKDDTKFPLSFSAWKDRWAFFNDDFSAQALLQLVQSSGEGAQALLADCALKHYRLFVRKLPAPHQDTRVVAAELLRQGDLLSDHASRQLLFRSLSHEIRTAVLSLIGFVDMAEQLKDKEQKHVFTRMRAALGRLENVVGRLSGLRAELEQESKPESVRKRKSHATSHRKAS